MTARDFLGLAICQELGASRTATLGRLHFPLPLALVPLALARRRRTGGTSHASDVGHGFGGGGVGRIRDGRGCFWKRGWLGFTALPLLPLLLLATRVVTVDDVRRLGSLVARGDRV